MSEETKLIENNCKKRNIKKETKRNEKKWKETRRNRKKREEIERNEKKQEERCIKRGARYRLQKRTQVLFFGYRSELVVTRKKDAAVQLVEY